MANYIIDFVAKTSWEGRINGLPNELHAYLLFDGYNRKAFDDAIEAQTAVFLKVNAFFCQSDQGQVIDLRQMPQDRMLVPIRWIVDMKVRVINVVGEISQADEQGVERLADGSEPKKQ